MSRINLHFFLYIHLYITVMPGVSLLKFLKAQKDSQIKNQTFHKYFKIYLPLFAFFFLYLRVVEIKMVRAYLFDMFK